MKMARWLTLTVLLCAFSAVGMSAQNSETHKGVLSLGPPHIVPPRSAIYAPKRGAAAVSVQSVDAKRSMVLLKMDKLAAAEGDAVIVRVFYWHTMTIGGKPMRLMGSVTSEIPAMSDTLMATDDVPAVPSDIVSVKIEVMRHSDDFLVPSEQFVSLAH